MRTERGFTLLEVMVALAIAGLALSVMFKIAGDGIVSAHAAGGYEQAISLARSHLAALGHESALREGEFSGADPGGYRWRMKIIPKAVSRPPSADTVRPMDDIALPVVLYAVEIGESWQGDGRAREVVLHTERIAAAGSK